MSSKSNQIKFLKTSIFQLKEILKGRGFPPNFVLLKLFVLKKYYSELLQNFKEG